MTNSHLKLLENFSFLLAYPIKEHKFYGDWQSSQGDSFELGREKEEMGRGDDYEILLAVLHKIAMLKFYCVSCFDQEPTRFSILVQGY